MWVTFCIRFVLFTQNIYRFFIHLNVILFWMIPFGFTWLEYDFYLLVFYFFTFFPHLQNPFSVNKFITKIYWVMSVAERENNSSINLIWIISFFSKEKPNLYGYGFFEFCQESTLEFFRFIHKIVKKQRRNYRNDAWILWMNEWNQLG